jgi:hypothetical protein
LGLFVLITSPGFVRWLLAFFLSQITAFSLSGSDADPNFFPITVWLQGEWNAAKFAQAGVDVYVDAAPSHAITQAMLTELKNNGIFEIGTINSVALNSPDTSQVIGWFSYDEPDDAQQLKNGSYGPCIEPSVVVSTYKDIKSQDTTHNRPVFLNFGMGVADVNWVGRGVCTGKTNMYPEYAQGADIVSFDIYPRNSGYPLEIIATGVDNLRKWTNYSKPVWCYIETTKISTTSKGEPTASDMKTEVWMALIHGAVGINYFCHQITPFVEDGCVENATIAAAMKSINTQIKSLAPVLNSQTVEGTVTVSSSNPNVPVSIMVKVYEKQTYIFAVAMRDTSVTATFTIKGITNAVATVIGESRTRQVSNGVFSDNFSGYQVHLYSVNAVLK